MCTEIVMHRLFILVVAVYYVGDPGLTLLSQFNEVREYLVAFVLALAPRKTPSGNRRVSLTGTS